MAKLVWDQTGQHFYETGVSKGVLFLASTDGTGWEDGVAWSGLTSVSESPEGADEEAFYADNIKYLSLRGVEDFGGSISAYTYPDAWEECDGTIGLYTSTGNNGPAITIGQQPRRAFCLVYVTQKGNDVRGSEYGYIIHVIYNATASPSEREYATINDSPEPIEFSWDYSTNPIPVTGHKSTSVLKIDSTKIASAALTKINDALFGSDNGPATLLTPDEIVDLVTKP